MRMMEPGLGYHYPAGTPAPRSESRVAYCEACGYETPCTVIFDLGTADLIIGGKDSDGACPHCGYNQPPMRTRHR